jgi:hypothetical protein
MRKQFHWMKFWLPSNTNNPQLKMYDADIQSMDAAAKGAKVGCHHKLTLVCL